MSTAIIKKSTLKGVVQAPSSKSFAHRIMICCALSRSKCTIKNVSPSDDMDATIGCLTALGVSITKQGSTIFMDSTDFVKNNSKEHFTLDCKESGTTLRIMIPICCALGLNVTFIGSGRLPQRPLDEYLTLLPQHGIKIEKGEASLPLTVSGQLCGDNFEISPKVSSQYVSGLIFALSLLDNDTTLELSSKLLGGQYVDITTQVMGDFGVKVEKHDTGYKIKGAQKYRAQKNGEVYVEGDWSQAAFFLCGGAINGDVEVTNLNTNSCQGDKKIVEILKSLGADIEFTDNGVRVKKSELKGTTIDATDTPDLVPVVALTCTFAQGDTSITGVERLKFKESDRLLSTSEMIKSLGGQATYTTDCMTVKGQKILKGGKVKAYNDHRIVMASAVGALCTENDTVIEDAHAVNKSYSEFFDDYNALGGKADVKLG